MSSERRGQLVVGLAVVTAYLGELQRYIRMADDHPFAALFVNGPGKWVAREWAAFGLRRSVAKLANGPLCASPVELTGWLCVGLHLIAVLLFHAAARRLLKSELLAVVLAVLLGAFPGVSGAVTWACGTYLLSSALCFVAALLVILRAAQEQMRSPWPTAVAAFVLVFVSNVIGEQLVFASILLGPLGWSTRAAEADVRDWRRMMRTPWVWAPAAAVITFIALALLTSPGAAANNGMAGHLEPRNFNPRTLLSVWFYQTRHLDMLQPWWSGGFHVAFLTWSFARFVAAGVLACGLGVAAVRFVGNKETAPRARVRRETVALLLAMMLAVSFVHALAGGYSGSSRHQYGPTIVALLTVGAIARARGMPDLPRGLRHLLAPLALGSVVTAWLVTGVERFENLRHMALVNDLAARPVTTAINVDYVPPLYRYWPHFERSTSQPPAAEWVINIALRARGQPGIVLSPGASLTLRVEGERPPFSVTRVSAGGAR